MGESAAEPAAAALVGLSGTVSGDWGTTVLRGLTGQDWITNPSVNSPEKDEDEPECFDTRFDGESLVAELWGAVVARLRVLLVLDFFRSGCSSKDAPYRPAVGRSNSASNDSKPAQGAGCAQKFITEGPSVSTFRMILGGSDVASFVYDIDEVQQSVKDATGVSLGPVRCKKCMKKRNFRIFAVARGLSFLTSLRSWFHDSARHSPFQGSSASRFGPRLDQ